MADRLLLTKTDLASADTVQELRRRLRNINPTTTIHVAPHARIPTEVRGWFSSHAASKMMS